MPYRLTYLHAAKHFPREVACPDGTDDFSLHCGPAWPSADALWLVSGDRAETLRIYSEQTSGVVALDLGLVCPANRIPFDPAPWQAIGSNIVRGQPVLEWAGLYEPMHPEVEDATLAVYANARKLVCQVGYGRPIYSSVELDIDLVFHFDKQGILCYVTFRNFSSQEMERFQKSQGSAKALQFVGQQVLPPLSGRPR